MSDPLPGYSGFIRDLLERKGARIGCRIRIVRKGLNEVIEGILMPKHMFSDPNTIVVKLDNGYNIGVKIREQDDIEVLGEVKVERIERAWHMDRSLPKVKVIGTGGTIASKVEYETGAVRPSLEPSDLLELMPELTSLAFLDTEVLFNILSENMTPRHWEILAERIAKVISEDRDVKGIVVAHGTDTMSYTAAAIAFAIQRPPTPIVFVGAQRSSDRPSTDAIYNFISAVITAVKAPFGESVVCMHATSSDKYNLVHRGVKVRKMHSSRRDAFQSINDRPLAIVDPEKFELKIINDRYTPRGDVDSMKIWTKFDDRVAIVKAYPGFQAEIIDMLVDKGFHGIVIEGTGLGHIGEYAFKAIERALQQGIPVVMTTQTLFGRINMNVYATGRKLLAMGVIPGEDMLPEVAYVKLCWILTQTRDLKEVRRMMLTNYVHEINPIHTYDLYPRWEYL